MRNLDGTGLKRLHRDWRRRADADVTGTMPKPRPSIALATTEQGIAEDPR